jgi:ubiquinone/menaquinone biosynthesis C-methylase UbiE
MNNIIAYRPTERFTDVVEDYDKYRPRYPAFILEALEKNYKITNNYVIADVGSGTGIFSRLFVEKNYMVYGIEPNDRMREKSEQEFALFPHFKAIKGTAENILLADNSVDIVTVAQAFHWFETEEANNEFYRILKDNGMIVLVWNERRNKDNPFMSKYERLLRKFCPDYNETNHKKFTYENIKQIFKGHSIDLYMIDNIQEMDLNAFIGRVKSCSYCISNENKNYNPFMKKLNDLFNTYQNQSIVSFDYNTIMYVILK